jgi:hypothetical protein
MSADGVGNGATGRLSEARQVLVRGSVGLREVAAAEPVVAAHVGEVLCRHVRPGGVGFPQALHVEADLPENALELGARREDVAGDVHGAAGLGHLGGVVVGAVRQLGAGLVVDGNAVHAIMPIGRGEENLGVSRGAQTVRTGRAVASAVVARARWGGGRAGATGNGAGTAYVRAWAGRAAARAGGRLRRGRAAVAPAASGQSDCKAEYRDGGGGEDLHLAELEGRHFLPLLRIGWMVASVETKLLENRDAAQQPRAQARNAVSHLDDGNAICLSMNKTAGSLRPLGVLYPEDFHLTR